MSTFAGYNDWRQPTYGELQGIVADACSAPKLNASVFVNAQNFKTWTSTEDPAAAAFQRFVNLFTGVRGGAPRGADFALLQLVRGGEFFDPRFPNFAVAQTLLFDPPPPLVIGKTASVGAANAAINSGNAIVLSSLTPAVCSVASSGLVSLTAAAVVGNTCTIAANQFGRYWDSVNYAAAGQATQSLIVSTAPQSLAFGPTPVVTVGASGTLSATSNVGLLPVTFSSTTLGVCTVSGSTVNGVGAGACVIQADQLGSATVASATANLTITVSAASQTLSFSPPPNVSIGTTGSVSATSSAGLTPVTLTSLTLPVCTLSSGVVSGVSAGLCTLQATQSGNGNIAAAGANLSFRISANSQTLNFGSAPNISAPGSVTVTATSSRGLTPVSYTSLTTPVCLSVGGGALFALSTGICTIQADQAGNGNVAAATASLSFNIAATAQTLSFSAAPNLNVGASGALSATSSAGATPVALVSLTLPVCTITGGVVTGVAAGTCTLQASQIGGANLAPATAATSFAIGIGCNLRMDGVNDLSALKEGLILTRAMLGFTGTAVTDGTGITTPWDMIRDRLNLNCGTRF